MYTDIAFAMSAQSWIHEGEPEWTLLPCTLVMYGDLYTRLPTFWLKGQELDSF